MVKVKHTSLMVCSFSYYFPFGKMVTVRNFRTLQSGEPLRNGSRKALYIMVHAQFFACILLQTNHFVCNLLQANILLYIPPDTSPCPKTSSCAGGTLSARAALRRKHIQSSRNRKVTVSAGKGLSQSKPPLSFSASAASSISHSRLSLVTPFYLV